MERETIFTQLGKAAIKIAKLLSEDQSLCRLLKYNVENPFDTALSDITKEEVYDKNVRLRPLIRLDELSENFVLVSWNYGETDYNQDTGILTLSIDIFTDIKTWNINDICQRPFKIMDSVYTNLNNLRVSGIGKLLFQSFELKILSDEYSQHKMVFTVNVMNSNETIK